MKEYKLYKKDSKGKIRVWSIETEGSILRQKSGILDGKLVTNEKTCISKNVGKSNKTTPEEQALLELESEYKSKLDEGYFETKEEAETEEVILPMLAKSYGDHKSKINWKDVFVQPKLDGMRCLIIIKNGQVSLKSRDGKKIENMDHIINDLNLIKGDMIMDGELYAHGLTFQENMKLVKKYRQGETEKIIFNCYDYVSKLNFNSRFAFLKSEIIDKNLKYLEFVKTFRITSEQELVKYHSQFISKGYEGTIIRHGDKPYGIDKRCDSLLKYKDFQDIDAVIKDIVPAEQRPEWGVPVLEYDGKEFRSGTRLSHDERKELLINKQDYIGKLAVIRFFEYTDEGLPRFPVFTGVRLDLNG